MTRQPDLFTYRDLPDGIQAPSGPATVIPTREEGTREQYEAWRLTKLGAWCWALICGWALEERDAGARRISVNRLVERVRIDERLRINNTWRAYIADDLVALHPELDAVIERRKRTKTLD